MGRLNINNHKRAKALALRLVDSDQKQAYKNLVALIEQCMDYKQSQSVLVFNDFLAEIKDKYGIPYDQCCEYMAKFQRKVQ